MTKKTAEKIVKGITDKIECNTSDIDDWAEFWGFTREEYEEFLDMMVKALEQESCYNFDEWCHDCSEYNQDKHCCPRYNKVIRNAVEEIKQEPKAEQEIREELNRLSTYRVPNSNTDLVSRKAVERVLNLVFRGHREQEPKTGHWIYKNDNWHCSECGETPKTLGYVGDADFMREHFKFCNHCGAKMESEEI